MAAPGPPQQNQNPTSSSASQQQQQPIPTNPDQISWDGDKMYFSFLLSLSLPHPPTPKVQHLHLRLLQKARLSQDRKRTRRRGRHLSRVQTAHQRSARPSFRVCPFFFLSLPFSPFDPFSRWWSVFWVLFQAKNNGAGSEDAMLYHKVPHIPHFHRLTSPLVPKFFSLVSSIRTS